MPNYYGRMGAPMIQPTKDQFREWLTESQRENQQLKVRNAVLERRLAIATRKLGESVIDSEMQRELVLADAPLSIRRR